MTFGERDLSTRRLSSWWVVLSAAGAVSTMFGCSGDSDRPAPVKDCAELGCPSNGGAGGSAGGSGNRAGGGGGGGGASGSHSVSGSVRIFDEPTLLASREFLAAGIIGVTGSKRVEGTFEAGHFSVAGADSAGELWADMRVTSTPPEDALDTLEPIDTSQSSPMVVFVPKTHMDNIIGALSTVQSRRDDAAQIVIRFVDNGGRSVPGVVVAQPGFTIAYDAGNAYTD